MPDEKPNAAAAFLGAARKVEQMMAFADDRILRDLEESSPALRRFLLGGRVDNGHWPAGTITLRRNPRGIRVAIRIELLEVEAVYERDSWEEIWETLENDLQADTVPWDMSYTAKKRREGQLRSLRSTS